MGKSPFLDAGVWGRPKDKFQEPPLSQQVESTMYSAISESSLQLLYSQVDNFPTLRAYVRQLEVPSVLLLPQTLTHLDGELSRNSGLLFEAFSFLDVMSLVSMTTSGNPNQLSDSVVGMIKHNRTVNNTSLLLAANETANLIYGSEEDIDKLLGNNKVLIAIFLFSLVNKIFYRE